jgi:hypothetical protein
MSSNAEGRPNRGQRGLSTWAYACLLNLKIAGRRIVMG